MTGTRQLLSAIDRSHLVTFCFAAVFACGRVCNNLIQNVGLSPDTSGDAQSDRHAAPRRAVPAFLMGLASTGHHDLHLNNIVDPNNDFVLAKSPF
jgi:hypothetical protein